MNRWTSASVALCMALVATAGVAQTTEDMQKQLDEQKAQIQKLMQQSTAQQALIEENAQLKSQLAGDALETEINRLSERLAAGTTLKSAANQITMSGEFRYRGTWSFGDNAGLAAQDEHDGSYTDARVRLGFLYEFTCDVSAYAELQANWAYGDNAEGPISAIDFGNGGADLQLYQGWLKVGNLFGRHEFSGKGGRQEIVLGHQFQFGNADWFNGVIFDGARWDWDSDSFSLTGLMLKLSTQDSDINQYYSAWQTPHDDDELYGVYFTLKTIKNHKLDIYWMYVNGHAGANGGGSLNSGAVAGFGNNNDLGGGGITGFLYPGSEAYFHTIGARIGGWFDVACGLDWNLEAAYQFGDSHNLSAGGTDDDVDAFTVEGELGITFGKESRFRIYARGLFAEGPDEDDVGYLTLFPNRHSNTASFRARYGLADVIPMSNVWTAQLGLHFDPFKGWTFGATALFATADEEGSNGFVSGGSDDDDYCWEIDVWGEYRYSDQLTFGGGVAFVFPEDQGSFMWGVDDDMQFIGYLQARLWF